MNPSSSDLTSSDLTSSDLKRVHVLISGRVQGVGYRFSTQDMAMLLKLNGWVRNLTDGRVEAAFEGSADQIEEIVRWCHKGPPAAVVKEVQVDYELPEGLRGFEVLKTRSV